MRRASIFAVVLSVAVAACGGSAAPSCEAVADETIALTQQLIDEVEADVGDVSLDQLADRVDDLPSVADYQREWARLDARAGELGCGTSQMRQLVTERTDRLTAHTAIGRLIVGGLANGGL